MNLYEQWPSVLLLIAAVTFEGGCTPAPVQTATYDVVLARARIIDPESGLDGVRHLGIKDGKIAAVSGAPLQGEEVIDVNGLVVAPGFIDLNTHGDGIPDMRMQAFDGVTTALELEAGKADIAEYYERLTRQGRPLNFGASVGWAHHRAAVLDGYEPSNDEHNPAFFGERNWSTKLSTPQQQDQILARIERELKAGGLGIGVLLGYAPAANRKEIYRVNELGAEHGVPTFTHVRSGNPLEPNSSFEALQEMIALAAGTGARVHICHLNSSSTVDLDAAIRLLAEAQKRQGLKITTEAYPYGAGSTQMGAPFLLDPGPEDMKAIGIDFSDIVYLKTGERMTPERLREIQKEDPNGWGVVHYLKEDNRADMALLDKAILFPGAAIASDGLPWFAGEKRVTGDVWPLPENALGHPHTAGTYSRILGRYVRERKVMTLMEAIRKSSLIPAQILEAGTPQMRNKGRIRLGADADIVVFDPNTVIDRATYEKPAQTSLGMQHVLVNGTFVVKTRQLVPGALPGKPVRRLVQ